MKQNKDTDSISQESSQSQLAPQTAMERYKKYTPAIAVIAAVIVVGGVVAIGNYLNVQSRKSDASCYGYNCQPSVRLGARIPTYGYGAPLSYGSLTVRSGQSIELSWNAQNVDSCRAEDNWTTFTGLYYPPTLFAKPITENRSFSVACYRNKNVVARSTINIVVEAVPASSVSAALHINNPGPQQYTMQNPQTNVPFLMVNLAASTNQDVTIRGIRVAVDTNNNLDIISALRIFSGTTELPLSSVKQTSEGAAKVLIATFASPVRIPAAATITLRVNADVAKQAVGPMRFTLRGLDTQSNTQVIGLPLIGNYMTFIVFNCIKEPCGANNQGGATTNNVDTTINNTKKR